MIFPIRAILLIAFGIVLGCSKEEASWIEIGKSDVAHIYMGKRIVMGEKPESPFLGVSELMDYHKPEISPKGSKYESIKMELMVNCSREQMAIYEYEMYSGQMATGNILESESISLKDAEKELRDIGDIATREIASRACSRTGKKMGRVD
jgi:hypothetical protein